MSSSFSVSDVLHALLHPTHRDGPDLHLLDPLSPPERATVEQHLLERLARRNDDSVTVIAALTYLGSDRAVDPLRQIMRTGSRRDAVRAAVALWTLRTDEEALRMLCRTVAERPGRRRRERRDAAAALTHIPRRAALAALITALDDRDITVSANAHQAVRERLRLNAEADAVASGHLDPRSYRDLARAALDTEYPP